MAKLPIVSWIGNAAAVLVGGWGAVSRQAQAVGCSRQTAYDHAEKVEAAVGERDRWRTISRTTPAATTSAGGADHGVEKTAG